jgi:hypothetical protein
MRLEGWNESVPGSILRDAVLRTAPQDEVVDFFTRSFTGHDTAIYGRAVSSHMDRTLIDGERGFLDGLR